MDPITTTLLLPPSLSHQRRSLRPPLRLLRPTPQLPRSLVPWLAPACARAPRLLSSSLPGGKSARRGVQPEHGGRRIASTRDRTGGRRRWPSDSAWGRTRGDRPEPAADGACTGEFKLGRWTARVGRTKQLRLVELWLAAKLRAARRRANEHCKEPHRQANASCLLHQNRLQQVVKKEKINPSKLRRELQFASRGKRQLQFGSRDLTAAYALPTRVRIGHVVPCAGAAGARKPRPSSPRGPAVNPSWGTE